MDKGHIRLYTGDGKGKTTMALGLALRFAGAGKRVFIGQFIKDDPRGDIMALRKAIPGVVTAQFGCGTGCICGREPDAMRAAISRHFVTLLPWWNPKNCRKPCRKCKNTLDYSDKGCYNIVSLKSE